MIFSWIDFNEKYFNHYNISFIISMVSYPIDLFPFTTWSSHSPCKIKTTWNKFKCVLIYILLLSYRHVEILKRLTSFEKGHIIQLNSNGRSTNIIIHMLWRSFFLTIISFHCLDLCWWIFCMYQIRWTKGEDNSKRCYFNHPPSWNMLQGITSIYSSTIELLERVG